MNTNKLKLMACSLVALIAMGSAQAQYKNSAASSRNIVFPVSANADIPSSITFCGEKVSFDRLDMFERLDRELTGIIYGHTTTLMCLKRANRYFPALAKILKEQNVPLDFLYLAVTESSMDHNAYSSAKAAGIWQLLAGTARDYGLQVDGEVDERYDPEKSTVAACKYLKSAYNRYKHWPTVAASYNAGMGHISGELSKQSQESSFDLYLNKETTRYVFRIIAYKLLFENPKRYGYRLYRNQLYQPVSYTTVDVTTSVSDWSSWAIAHNITYAQLREANPWIRATKLTNSSGKTYKVRVPVSKDLYRSKRSFTVYDKNWTVD